MSTNTPAPGTLYGIGVGPGSPDLLTMRAVSLLRATRSVFAASSSRNEYSSALDIARPHLPEEARVTTLPFPMTRDHTVLTAAWEENARAVAAVLHEGEDAVFLTLGDPLIYSTFGYLMHTLADLYPHLPVAVVPGITSFQAAAAETRTVLCEGEENLMLLSGVMDGTSLAHCVHKADNAVILKAYRTLPAIRASLEGQEEAKTSLFVSRLGLAGQCIVPLDQAPEKPNYLSLVLATSKNRV